MTQVLKVNLPYCLRTSSDNELFYKTAHDEHKFILPHCKSCDKYFWPGAFICQHCGSFDVEWKEASGHGKIYSHVEGRFPFHPDIKEYLPIGICSVVLDEGPRVFGRLLNYGDIEKIAAYDAPVHLVWLQDEEKGCTIMGFEMD
ncbi:MAG: OB-fold domain-containing protein [Deltaproteobacteria bacterium]|nr:OB-fold domain-containing protein [Deltaproteobacteria bacterium]